MANYQGQEDILNGTGIEKRFVDAELAGAKYYGDKALDATEEKIGEGIDYLKAYGHDVWDNSKVGQSVNGFTDKILNTKTGQAAKSIGDKFSDIFSGISKVNGKIKAGIDFFKNLKKRIKLFISICIFSLTIIIFIIVILLSTLASVGDWVSNTCKKVSESWDYFKSKFSADDRYPDSFFREWNNPTYYDVDALEEWNKGYSKVNTNGDPDYTFILWQQMKTGDKSNENGENELSGDLKELESATKEIKNDNLLVNISPESMEDIYKYAYEYNSAMFTKRPVKYEYSQWNLVPQYAGDIIKNYKWKNESVIADTLTDNLYDESKSRNLLGETKNGNHIFSIHWQDMMAMAYYTGVRCPDKEGLDALKTGRTKGYYLKDEEFKKIKEVFSYKFEYYPSNDNDDKLYSYVNDNKHMSDESAYKFEDLYRGARIGYRYLKPLAEPDTSKTYKKKEMYSDAYPYTKIVPETAPANIYNGWELYHYVYKKTTELPDGYYGQQPAADREKVSPPEGQYCIGRYHIVQPAGFIECLSSLEHDWYKNTQYGITVEKNGTKVTYIPTTVNDFDWKQEIVQNYLLYLQLITSDIDMNGTVYGTSMNHLNYFKWLADLYSSKQIVLTYEGTMASQADTNAFLTNWAKNGGIGIGEEWSIVVDSGIYTSDEGEYSCNSTTIATIKRVDEKNVQINWKSENALYNAMSGQINSHNKNVPIVKQTGDYYKVDENLTTVPFFSYGVTYYDGESRNIDIIIEPSVEPQPGGGDSNTPLPKPENGQVYINHKITTGKDSGKNYEGWVRFYDGAFEDLTVKKLYSREQIRRMLVYLENAGRGAIRFSEATDAVYEYNQQTGRNVAGQLAIILTEGCHRRGSYGDTKWNFFDFKSVNGWMNFKEYGNMPDALVANFKWLDHKWFFGRGQKSYYLMCWRGYGNPQSSSEALDANKRLSYSYCPWWDDVGFVATHDSANLWTNKCANYKRVLEKTAGLE